MAIKPNEPPPPRLTPIVARIVARDRLPPSTTVAKKLSPAQVAELKAIIRGGVLPEGAFSRSRAIAALVQRERTGDVALLLSQVLANTSETQATRIVAAASLELVRTSESEGALTASLEAPDPLVRRRVIRSLGVVGGEAALRALDRTKAPADDAGRRQLAFAKALIAHRIGIASRHLAFREGTEPPASKKGLINLTLRPLRAAALRADRAAMRGADFGIRVSERVGFSLKAGAARWTVFVNRDLPGLTGFSKLFERPWVTALLSRYDERTEGNAVQYVVLTDPDESGATIMVVRPDGELFYSGHATRRGSGLFTFAMLDVARAGTAPTKVTGQLTAKGVSLDIVMPFGQRKNKSQGDEVVV